MKSSKLNCIVGPMLAGALLLSGSACAGTITPEDAVSYEYFGLNYLDNVQTSRALGTLNYSSGAGCGGTCQTTTSLGVDPSAKVWLDEVPFEGASGGYATAIVGFFFVPSMSGTVTLHAAETLAAYRGAAGPDSQSVLMVGQAGDEVTPYLLDFAADVPLLFQDTDCSNYCATGVANYTAPLPLPSNQNLNVVGGVQYYVYESIYVGQATNAGQLTVEADPSITSDTPGLILAFSPGIASAVPEPSVFGMMVMGGCALSLCLLARRPGRHAS
jgi:hypothetical protein